MKHADVPFVIDFHTHMLDEELRAICTSRNVITGFGKKEAPPSANLRRFLDPELQIADMDERGIDMASMIYEGLLDAVPRLKIVIAHGGGYFATCMGRLDRNIEKAEARVNIGYKKPSDYLGHFYYDTCVYDPLALATLFKRVGADRIVLGADYPVGGSDPVGEVK